MNITISTSFRRIATGIAAAIFALSTMGASAAPAASPPLTELHLERYKGKVVYIDFWASWCGPCKQSFGFMKDVSARYPSKDFVILTVNVDRQKATADRFLGQVGSTLPVVYDTNGAIARSYKVADMPTSVLIGKDGKVRFRHAGFFPARKAEYEAHIAQLVRE